MSHNLNQLIKKFTIWTVAIMLANLVISIFSMNVALPLRWSMRIGLCRYQYLRAEVCFWLWKLKKW